MATTHVRLTFSGDEVKRPLIYELGHEFKVVTNIRMADVDRDVGWVVLELEGDEDEIERSLRVGARPRRPRRRGDPRRRRRGLTTDQTAGADRGAAAGTAPYRRDRSVWPSP